MTPKQNGTFRVKLTVDDISEDTLPLIVGDVDRARRLIAQYIGHNSQSKRSTYVERDANKRESA